MNYLDYPQQVVEDIVRLRRRMKELKIPNKISDQNLIIGTWNIQAFGRVYKEWDENPDSPKRNLRAMAIIAEIIRQFDVIAIQEVKRDTIAIHMLLEEFLGPNWDLIISDVTAGSSGNTERLGFIYDKRRVQPSGLAGEVVLPPIDKGEPSEQFDRTPYIVGFQSGQDHFSLLTVHIRYGEKPEERIPEIKAFAEYIATEIMERSKSLDSEEHNLIVLGDFNIDRRGDNPLFQALISTGLYVPPEIEGLKTTVGKKPKFYDNIGWFRDGFSMIYNKNAGVINFIDAVYKELSTRKIPSRVSDHFPVWIEFIIDHSEEQMAQTLGVHPGTPNPMTIVLD